MGFEEYKWIWDKLACRSVVILAMQKKKKNPVLVIMPGIKGFLNLSWNQFIFSLLLAEYPPKPEGTSSSGQGQQALGASETQSGGDPRTAQQQDGTTTFASAPIYNPEHPCVIQD